MITQKAESNHAMSLQLLRRGEEACEGDYIHNPTLARRPIAGQFVIGPPPGASCDYKFPSDRPTSEHAVIY